MDIIEQTLEHRTILVTGGTGSFGRSVIKKLLENYNLKKIIVFSRDEKKQHDMRRDINHPRLHFVIGNVRERDIVFNAMKGVDFVFHAAALKHVPSCEFFPMEAVKTNILGASNVLDAAEYYEIQKIVVLSTDKAVYPINAMGLSKALMEKNTIAKAMSTPSSTTFCGVRYGNVMYSRGSVIPLFVNQIKQGQPLTVTVPYMTRFLLSLPNAVDLVLHALVYGKNGDIYVRKAPASTIQDLAQACSNIFRANNPIMQIGIRKGEKIHETLVSWEELMRAEEEDSYFCVKCDRAVEYERYLTEGSQTQAPQESYTSENAKRLTISEVEDLLLSLTEIKNALQQKAF